MKLEFDTEDQVLFCFFSFSIQFSRLLIGPIRDEDILVGSLTVQLSEPRECPFLSQSEAFRTFSKVHLLWQQENPQECPTLRHWPSEIVQPKENGLL